MTKDLSEPLDDVELTWLDDFLHDRIDDETGDRIAAAGGDGGILGVSELDGFLTAIVSSPHVMLPSRWLPAVWGAQEPIWASVDQFQEVFRAIVRHQNSIVEALLYQPEAFEPMFRERLVEARTYFIVDEWCHGYLRGLALHADVWSAGGNEIQELLRPIRLWGTEEGWRQLGAMSEADQEREREAIPKSARALHRYWIERRELPSTTPIRRAVPKVGRNDPCPCGSGKKYKHCCLQ